MIVKVVDERALAACLPVIRRAFRTVMDDMGLTEKDVPTSAAFMTLDTLRTLWASGTQTFALIESGRPVGCVSLRPASRMGVFDLERLAVAPEARHRGHGTALLDQAFAVARAEGATVVSIGIIEENSMLKQWYEAYGFVACGTRTFDHLPFTVCFMEKPVVGHRAR